MHIYVIWGFLGSGKTTLINHLLSIVFAKHKVVVIENESGKESVDGDFLRSKNYQVKDLKAGCICCTLRTELPACIEEIKQTIQPEILLIEPSGLASLEELLQMPQLSINVWITLVDVLNYSLLMRLNADFYKRQYALSPILVLTKTDIASKELVEEVCTALQQINFNAKIVLNAKSLTREFWCTMIEKESLKLKQIAPVSSLKSTRLKEPYTILVNSPLDTSFYVKEFNRINRPTSVIRAKGFIKSVDGSVQKVDYVNGSLSLEAMDSTFSLASCSLSVWGDGTSTELDKKWIDYFVNATEVTCSISNLAVKDDELYRYLGYGTAMPDVYISQLIASLKEEAMKVCSPHFGFRLQSAERLSTSSVRIGDLIFNPDPIITKCFQGSECFGVIVASVGTELNAWIESKRESGDVMVAFIADALGSTIVEAIVSWGVMYLASEMEAFGLRLSNSYSPGYCGWNVTEQQQFFSLLPPKFCGVSLTLSSLMLPIKSVSAVVGIGRTMQKKPYGCAICRKIDCYKRNIEKRKEAMLV